MNLFTVFRGNRKKNDSSIQTKVFKLSLFQTVFRAFSGSDETKDLTHSFKGGGKNDTILMDSDLIDEG